MRIAIAIAALGMSCGASADVVNSPVPLPGTYSNEEQVYFAKETKVPVPPLVFVRLDEHLRQTVIDAFGNVIPNAKGGVGPIAATSSGLNAFPAGGPVLELRRVRPVTCWASLRRDKPKADGSEDWTFSKDIKLHDQGGRALVGKGEAGVKPVVLRMRNVTWSGSARASNRPSLVLYVHTPDDPDHAVSYVWSDPGAARLGVNLRWMQASCTVDGLEKTTN